MKIKKNYLIHSYARSMGIEAAKDLITETIKSAALEEKEHYTEEETSRIYGELIKEGGSISIVAQNLVVQLERKKSKEQTLLLDNIENQIWCLTDKNTYGIVNKTHAEFLGLEKDELEGRVLSDIINGEEADVCIATNREVFEKKKQSHTEEWVKNGRGETRLLFITRTPKLDDKGDVEYVICTAEDITNRKHAEEKENIKKISLLSESAMWFVEFSPDEDIYYFIGEQLRKIVGEKSCIIVNSINKEQNILTTRSVIIAGNFLSKIIKHMGQHPVGITYNSSDEALDYLSDGKLHFYEEGLYGIVLKTVPELICKSIEKSLNVEKIYTIGFIKENKLSGTVAIFLQNDTKLLKNRDIIEAFINQASIALDRKRAEEELRKLNEELEQRVLDRTSQLNENKQVLLNLVDDLNMATKDLKYANERLLELDHMKSMFIASTSHELRTPLNSIIGFSSILLEGWEGELNPEQKEEIGYIHTAGKQLLDLITHLRQFKIKTIAVDHPYFRVCS